ncbi:hypothetical protein EN832_34590, partial [Mesorhizobium sp. M1C.F.Ca.ET.189.01.1.1]|uniref:arginine deiminase family protein n=1 Tax=Mesorhizobium sp. M1C.F.Ca.ET.189.01.1.1 TaxID=2563925 RepID=UPI001138175B
PLLRRLFHQCANGGPCYRQGDGGAALRGQAHHPRPWWTGGDRYEAEREQWDDGNNVVAVEPGVVIGYDRNVYTNTLLRRAGAELSALDGDHLNPR